MAKPLSATERQAIIDLLPTGKSCRDIAGEVGRSKDTVSRIAREVGHTFGRINVARAQEAMRGYGAEARATRLVKLHQRIDRILDRMGEPHTAFNFGGKDNTYEEREFPEPTTDALRQYAAAVAQLTRAEMEIVKHDERGDDDGADVDRWLDHIAGGG